MKTANKTSKSTLYFSPLHCYQRQQFLQLITILNLLSRLPARII